MDYVPIDILGGHHLLYLSILFIFSLLLFLNPQSVKQHRKTITKTILVVSLLQQMLLYGYFIIFDKFTLAESLPLHLSRITTLLIILYILLRKRVLFSLITYFSLFAWLSFLVPTDIQPITHPLGISFLINHVITVLIPFYIIIAYQIKIKSSDKYIAFASFIVYLMTVYFINPILGGNYFYLVQKPIFKTMPDSLYLLFVIVGTFIFFTIGEKVFKAVEKKYGK